MPHKQNESHSQTSRTEQRMMKDSTDEEFNIHMSEIVGYTALDPTPKIVRLAAVESADHAGVYGLLVLNADGSSVSTGGGGGSTASVYGTATYDSGTYS